MALLQAPTNDLCLSDTWRSHNPFALLSAAHVFIPLQPETRCDRSLAVVDSILIVKA
jgi:hypothetical protein